MLWNGLIKLGFRSLLLCMAVTANADLIPVMNITSASEQSLNFGNVLIGNDMSTKVRLINDTQRTVQITNIFRSCSCTSFVIDKTLIPAYASVILEPTIAERLREAVISADIAVEWKYTDSNTAPRPLQISLSGTYVSPYSVTPDTISLDIYALQAVQSVRIVVKPGRLERNLSHISVVTDDADGSVETFLREDANCVSGTLDAIIDPRKMFEGLNRRKIRLVAHSDDGKIIGEASVLLSINVHGNIRADVSQIFEMVGSAPVSEIVQLYSNDSKPFELLRLGSDVPWLSASEVNGPQNSLAKRRIQCKIQAGGPSQIGHLFIFTKDDTGLHRLQLPVMRSVAP